MREGLAGEEPDEYVCREKAGQRPGGPECILEETNLLDTVVGR